METIITIVPMCQIDKCFDECENQNSFQNVTNLESELDTCCRPVCQYEVNYHTTKRTVIIIIVSIILCVVCLCCLFGFFGPSVKKKWVITKEYDKRKPGNFGLSKLQFSEIAEQFKNIFSEEQRDNWVLSFHMEDQIILMHWFAIKMKQKDDFKYVMQLKGQDIYGMWVIKGYFVNTEKGPTVWGLKNYYNMENNTLDFENQSELIHEMTRLPNGNYQGRWINRKYDKRQGVCSLQKKGPGEKSEDILNPHDDPNLELISVPHTDQNF